MAHRVVAPYVTLKVKDQAGGWVVSGFYAGAVVPESVDEASLKHHLDSGLVEKVAEAQPEKPAAPARSTSYPQKS